MKNILNTLIVFALMIAGTATAQAQPKFDEGWKEKLMSEKIAFLTMELNITPEEAQTFWPVYNKVEKEIDQARHEVIMSYKALSEAVKAEKPSKETSELLDKYLKAKEAQDKLVNSAWLTF